MNDKQEAKFQELTGQPVGHLVCKMAAPTIISMMVTACYNMVDTYFVGQLHSNSATGAVGVVFSPDGGDPGGGLFLWPRVRQLHLPPAGPP